MQELWFFLSARLLMLIDIYRKFREYSWNGFHLTKRIRFCDKQTKFQGKKLRKYKRVILLRSARRLMLIDIYMKFREYSLNGCQVTERTRFLTDKVPR